MELRKLILLIKRRIPQLVLLGIVVAVIGGVIGYLWPTHYHAVLNVYVQKSPEEPANNEYTYDGYYAQQAAEMYTDTVVGLLEGDDVLAQALSASDEDLVDGVGYYRGKIRVEKVAPRLIRVEVVLGDVEKAKLLASAITKAGQERVSALNQERGQAFELKLVQPDPLVEKQNFAPWVFALVAFPLAITGGVAGIFLQEYIKEE